MSLENHDTVTGQFDNHVFSKHPQSSVSFDEIYDLKKHLESVGYQQVSVTTVDSEWVINVTGKAEKVKKQRAKKEAVA